MAKKKRVFSANAQCLKKGQEAGPAQIRSTAEQQHSRHCPPMNPSNPDLLPLVPPGISASTSFTSQFYFIRYFYDLYFPLKLKKQNKRQPFYFKFQLAFEMDHLRTIFVFVGRFQMLQTDACWSESISFKPSDQG